MKAIVMTDNGGPESSCSFLDSSGRPQGSRISTAKFHYERTNP